MFVYPLVRVNRAIVSSLIFANDPLTGIAISETLSVIIPLFNSKKYLRIASLLLMCYYGSEYSNQIIQIYFKEYTIYDQLELTSLVILNFMLLIDYLY